MYKIAKRHELSDGNKRSAVIAVYLFCILNKESFTIDDPEQLKNQVKRIAKTKGRLNEKMMRDRVADSLKEIIVLN